MVRGMFRVKKNRKHCSHVTIIQHGPRLLEREDSDVTPDLVCSGKGKRSP